jgi:hypothetical protein
MTNANPNPKLTPEQIIAHEQRRFDEAKRAHDGIREYLDRMQDIITKDAQTFVNILLTINGGAAVTLLGFVGALLAKQSSPIAGHVVQIATSLEIFAEGVGLAAATSGLSYLTNYCYTANAHRQKLHWDHPYIRSNFWAKFFAVTGTIAHVLAVVAAVTSLIFFLRGMYSISGTILTLKFD